MFEKIFFNCQYTVDRSQKVIPSKFNEIISLAAICVDIDGNIVDSFKILVRPYHFKKINNLLMHLTKIDNDMLENGVILSVALKRFQCWLIQYETNKLYAWSENCIKVFMKNCDILKDNNFINRYTFISLQDNYIKKFKTTLEPSLKSVLLNSNIFNKETILDINLNDSLINAICTSKIYKFYF